MIPKEHNASRLPQMLCLTEKAEAWMASYDQYSSNMITVASTQEAYGVLLESPIDVLLIDLNVREMDAFLTEIPKIQSIDLVVALYEATNHQVAISKMDEMEPHPITSPPQILIASVQKHWQNLTQLSHFQESSRALGNLLNAIPDIIYKIDASGTIVFINQAVEELGRPPEELIGQHISALIHPDDVQAHSRDNVLKKFRHKITGIEGAPKLIDERRNGHRMTKNLKIRLHDDLKRHAQSVGASVFSYGEISATGLKEKANSSKGVEEYIHTIGIIRDISIHEHQKCELEEQRLMAERESQGKSAFLANVSHEIRTPLNGILGFTHLLQGEPLSKTCQEYTNTIEQACENLLHIINDILNYSKLQSNEITLIPKTFDFYQTLDQVVALMRPTALSKGLELKAHHTTKEDFFIGDQNRIRQIIMNMVGNAVKFTEHGTVTVKSHIKKHEGRAQIILDVTDTGPGIAPEDLSHIFKRFAQSKSESVFANAGTGLGLAISQEFAKLMGGGITVQSTPGVGSTFTLSLHLPCSQKEELPKMERPSVKTQARFKGKILVAEDNPVNLTLAKKMLGKLGLEVHHASNGQEACDKIASNTYQLVFMDLQMPVMTGLDATKSIRKETPAHQLPIIALTANVSEADESDCLNAGMQAFMHKPVRMLDFIRVLNTYLPPTQP